MQEPWRTITCSFCGKPPQEVAQIITGMKGAAICDGCIAEAIGLLGVSIKAAAYDALFAPWFDPKHPMNLLGGPL